MDEMKPEKAGSGVMGWLEDVQAAIRVLSAYTVTKEEAPGLSTCSDRRAYELAIAALQYQIPMEPEKIEQEGAEPVFLCGRCKEDLGAYDLGRNHCTACGQRINWYPESKRRRKAERTWIWMQERFERVE